MYFQSHGIIYSQAITRLNPYNIIASHKNTTQMIPYQAYKFWLHTKKTKKDF